MNKNGRLHAIGRFCAAAACALALAGPARAADVTAFVTTATPSENWGIGYGAALSSGIAGILTFEGELAQLPLETGAGALTSFTASAMVSPPLGQLIPYGGIGFGLFRQTLGDRSDTGRIHALIIGLKWKLGSLAVVRADYREIDLSGEPLVPIDRRFTLGAGISF